VPAAHFDGQAVRYSDIGGLGATVLGRSTRNFAGLPQTENQGGSAGVLAGMFDGTVTSRRNDRRGVDAADP
jgi:hypothetical protein